jgi:hypothetical protein
MQAEKTSNHDHDHDHDHAHEEVTAKSVGEVWKGIEGFAATIKKACEAGKPDDAHDALHEIGHSLEAMEGLAAKELKDDESKAVAKSALKVLFDSYDAIDQVFHGGAGKKYEDVAKDIDDSMATIRKLFPAS